MAHNLPNARGSYPHLKKQTVKTVKIYFMTLKSTKNRKLGFAFQNIPATFF